MTSHLKLALAGVALTALLAACSPPAEDAAATPDGAAVAPVTSPDVHAFKIGGLDAYALLDGALSVPNDGKTLAIGEPKAAVDALLGAAGLPTDTLQLSIQPLLVKMGERTVLFDTGVAGQMGTANKLPSSLVAAGVQPGQVTDVFISHGHGDHVGGLVNAQGGLAVPNAAIRMAADEWTAIKADNQMAALVAVITPKVQTFQADAEIMPGIAAVNIAGHTPGHSGFEISGGSDSLLYIGDTMHHSVISVQRPDWTVAFDGREAIAEASRKALLQRAATGQQRIYAVHFPFPGLGRFRSEGESFVWVPES